MKEIITQLVKALVDNPEKVEVTEVNGETSVIFELKVLDADRGKVIGKQGRIIRAIRVLVGAMGARMRKRVNVEIVE